MNENEVLATRNLIEVHSWQLDEEALKDFFVQLKETREKASPSNKLDSRILKNGSTFNGSQPDDSCSLGSFLRSFKDSVRFKTVYTEKLTMYVDQEKVQAKKDVLHPGFNKNCGLRGC
jgi:hypothetical protein